jgi:GT2 family glycosyltransferase
MNNDIEVPWNWLQVLQDNLYIGSYGAVSPAIKTPGGLDVGAILDGQGRGRSLINDFETEPVWITGSCIYLSRNTLDSIGLLDEGLKFYFEDVDYCVRMKSAGIDFKCIREVVVVHHNSVSSSPEQKKVMMDESRKYFIKKHSWGYKNVV